MEMSGERPIDLLPTDPVLMLGLGGIERGRNAAKEAHWDFNFRPEEYFPNPQSSPADAPPSSQIDPHHHPTAPTFLTAQ